MKTEQGLRHNDGKIRYDLLEPFAMQELARVFTKGAQKYAPFNWLKGMDWSKCLASLKRHIAAFEQGEDFDEETECYHMAHAAWNALALVSYYKYAPHYDDRLHTWIPQPKIALDIDEVIAGFTPAWCHKWSLPTPTAWYFDDISGKFATMKEADTLNDFYLNHIHPLCDPKDIPFEPHCYITSRPVSSEITEEWLQKHGFPKRPVYTVGSNCSKVEAFKKSGADILVDDKYETYDEFSRAGLCCYLFDAPHNHRYDVGYRRIKSLSELKY